MKYCRECGCSNNDAARFCLNSGQPFEQASHSSNKKTEEDVPTHRGPYSSFVDSLNEYIGNKGPVDLNRRVLFSNVFKPHTTEEAEVGAALVIAAKYKDCISSELFTESKFIRLFAIPVIWYGLLDSPMTQFFNQIFPFWGIRRCMDNSIYINEYGIIRG